MRPYLKNSFIEYVNMKLKVITWYPLAQVRNLCLIMPLSNQ